MSTLSHHIAFVRLVDLVEGRFPADELAAARSHIVACPRCAAEHAWLERVIGLMRTDAAEQPPTHVVAAAKRLFQLSAPAPRRQALSANSPASVVFDVPGAPVISVLLPRNNPPPSI